MESILIVEDDLNVREQMARAISGGTFNFLKVEFASKREEALQKMTLRVPAVLVSDARLGGDLGGVELAREVHKRFPEIGIILASRRGDFKTPFASLSPGVFPFLTSTFDADRFRTAAHRALHWHWGCVESMSNPEPEESTCEVAQ